MRIAVDVRACLGPGAGANTYTRELIRALHELGEDVGMWFAGRQTERLAANLVPELQALRPAVRLDTCRLSNQLLYSRAALSIWSRWPLCLPAPRFLPRDVDLYHATFWPLPPVRCASVLTIHDLIAVEHPEWATPAMVAEQQAICRLAARFDAVVVDSEATRQVVLERCRPVPQRITVVPLGVSDTLLTPVLPELIEVVREQYQLDRPYVLSLCTRDPRKNLPRAIQAYDRLCAQQGAEWDLVLVGARGWGQDAVTPLLDAPRAGRVIVTGHVPTEHLPPLLAGASALVYVSLGEGFGLPPLEAMAVGCPVVTSNLSSLPEVVGEDGVLVDPFDVEAIADGLQRVLGDEALAADLRARGRARAQQFTWRATAQATLGVYRTVV